MSALVSLTRLPIAAVDGLRQVLRSKGSRRASEAVDRYLATNGRSAARFDASGYIFVTALPYLDETAGVSFANSPYNDLAAALFEVTGMSAWVLTAQHRDRFLGALADANFATDVLRSYYEAFTETREPESGTWMRDAIRALRQALEAVDQSTIVLLMVG